MKNLAVLLGVVAALVLVPARAAPADILDLSAGVFPDDQLAALSSGTDPFAVGGGALDIGTHFAFSAHSGPNGPSGYAVVSDPSLGEAQGHVCAYATVSPNVAAFAIAVERASGTLASVPSLAFFASDNGGEPPTGFPDALEIFVGTSGCGGVLAFGFGGPVVQGNIVVR